MEHARHFPFTVRFATTDERDAAAILLADDGMVVAELEGIGPSARGKLGEVVAETIERQLAERGAAGPGVASTVDPDALLSDQLFRARRSGATGIALVLGPLRAVAGVRGALDPVDCSTLRFLADATRERPVALLLDAGDRLTAGYGDPVALGELLASAPPEPTALPPPPPLVARPEEPASVLEPPRQEATPAATASCVEPATPPPEPLDEGVWSAWVAELASALGPQPLATLERLFTEAYVPLANAVDAGLDAPRARRARDEFRLAFASGYVDAFPTFAATTKRPRMVFDAHDTAARIGRLHGARTVRVLLVGAMRWDIGRDVQTRVVGRVGGRASFTDEVLLWSALPTTTMRQLETIARGIEALRTPAPSELEPPAPRMRNAEQARRMRVGPREVYKLDVVESRLSAAGIDAARAFPEIAAATADAIVRHVETLAPRTLLLVLGDHGFALEGGAARHGGASPEEVLVGAFALLTGEVH
jgi:hypothetical protein